MQTFTIVNFSVYHDHCASIHKAGCQYIQRDVKDHDGHTWDVEGTLEDALNDYIDEELIEMGFTTDDVKVHNCAMGS